MSRIGRGPGAARRWGCVAAVIGVLVAAPAVAGRLPVNAPRVEPRALLARMTASANVPYSGYAESVAALPFPEVPEVARLVDLLSETTRLRVWYASPDAWRVDALSGGGERDTYGAGTSTWLWDSGTRRALRVVGRPRVRLPRGADMTPPELGRRLARLATADDVVTALRPRRVAGVAAAGVRVEPRGEATTVRRVDLWADPASGLPVRVEVTAKGQSRPAVTASFLDLERSAPDRARVTFEPPRDAAVDVTTSGDLASSLDEHLEVPLPATLAGLRKRATVARSAATYGEGYGVVAVVALPDWMARRILARVKDPIETPLLNGLVVVDESRAVGYAVSGAVPPATLRQVADALVAA